MTNTFAHTSYILLHSFLHPLNLTLHHLHKPWHHLLDLPALYLIEMIVDVIKQFITQLFGHVPSIASSDEGDGGKFTGILLRS